MSWIDLQIEIIKALVVSFPIVFIAYIVLGKK